MFSIKVVLFSKNYNKILHNFSIFWTIFEISKNSKASCSRSFKLKKTLLWNIFPYFAYFLRKIKFFDYQNIRRHFLKFRIFKIFRLISKECELLLHNKKKEYEYSNYVENTVFWKKIPQFLSNNVFF